MFENYDIILPNKTITMTTYDKQKLTEAVVYILNKTGSIGYYHIFKILYFANAEMLAKFGKPLVADKFYALQDGPVPTMLFDCLKGYGWRGESELDSLLSSAVERGWGDAYYIVSPKREPKMEFLSKADTQALDDSINEHLHMGYQQLREKSHGAEWERAYNSRSGNVMESAGMARDAGANEDMVDYIREMEDIQNALL